MCILTSVQGNGMRVVHAPIILDKGWIWSNPGQTWEVAPGQGRGPGITHPRTHRAARLNAFGLWLGGGAWDGKVCSRDVRATGSGLVKPVAASGAPSPKSTPTPGLPGPSSPREPSFVRGKRGPGAPTTPTMPHRQGAGNYSSREAARRGPPTPRGLQSHVQASLVNSARARAASVRPAANVPESAAPHGR